jgi:hypothetical protein
MGCVLYVGGPTLERPSLGARVRDGAPKRNAALDHPMDLSLESYEVLADGRSFVRSDQDERAIGIFENLSNSVDDIPPPLIEAAEAFRSRLPDAFEKTLSRALQAIGIEPDPASAADFIQALLQSADRQLA